ncbi:MAG: hypothetical protein AAF747_03695 [Planctomycetota bacterium]
MPADLDSSISPAAARRRLRQRRNARIKAIRRLHMHFGLILMPLVLLYGVTGLLFNHPTIFAAGTTEQISEDMLASLVWPEAEAVANSAIQQLAEAGIEVERAPNDKAGYEDYVIIDSTGTDERRRYRVWPNDSYGTVRITPTTDARVSPFPNRLEPFAADLLQSLADDIAETDEQQGARVRLAPGVEFAVMLDGKKWVLEVDGRDGRLDARPVSEPTRPYDVRTFLTRLHRSHGYSRDDSSRWLWALAVDVTSSMMVFWAISGMIMWWQIKPTRSLGMAFVVLGVIAVFALGWAMLRAIYY